MCTGRRKPQVERRTACRDLGGIEKTRFVFHREDLQPSQGASTSSSNASVIPGIGVRSVKPYRSRLRLDLRVLVLPQLHTTGKSALSTSLIGVPTPEHGSDSTRRC